MGPEVGKFIRGLHESHGVKFHLGQTVANVQGRKVTLSGGSAVEADLIVLGVGVRPALSLAEQAGLTVDRGVIVDEYLETSVPGIFAAGDIARWPDPHSGERIRVEHWVVAERQGQVVARNMLGARDRFDDIPFFWSAHYDKLSIRYIGHAERWDETKIEGDVMKMDCAVSYMSGGKRRAVATINRDRDNVVAEVEFETELLLRPPPPVTLEATEA
jgi:NADPH-dependent 2,4-dienoyl-CoA reductase/sulfur reductase-like enzyme